MSATRLLVLGVVRMYGRAHGYQVRRELLTWSADKWANAAPGSIYHALKKMAKEKLLEEVDTGEDGPGPDRTAYQLTPDGETEFQVLLAKSLSEYDDSAQAGYNLAAAVTFLTALPRARAIGLLRHRINQMAAGRATVSGVLEHGVDWGQPPHVTELYRLGRQPRRRAGLGARPGLPARGRRVRDGRRLGRGVRPAREREQLIKFD